jgi:Lrp/AsnC family transcriptional regulator
MIEKIELDSIDRQILLALQQDATISMQALADKVGLSANPVWRRIKRLEESGVITARVVVVDPVRLGLRLTTFVAIRTSQHEVKWLETFAKAVRRIPEIIECHRMSGDVDYFLKIIVRDMAHYDTVYKTLIAAVPGLIDVSSTFSMERLKETARIDPATA